MCSMVLCVASVFSVKVSSILSIVIMLHLLKPPLSTQKFVVLLSSFISYKLSQLLTTVIAIEGHDKYFGLLNLFVIGRYCVLHLK